MMNIMVKIMVEVLSVLAIATKEVTQSKTSESTPEKDDTSWLNVLQKHF